MAEADRALPRWVWAVFGVFAVGFLLYALRGVLTAVLLAFLIAYLLDPVVDRLEAIRIPRAWGILIVLIVVLGLLALALVLLVPRVVHDLATFVATLPHRLEQLLEASQPLFAKLGLPVPHSLGEALGQWQVDAQQVAEKVVAPLGSIVGWVVGGTVSFIGAFFAAIMVPVFAFYLLYDFDRMTAGIRELLPWRYRESIVSMAREVDQVLGQFIRGQLLVMLLLGILYAVGYAIVGVQLALVVGLVAGLLAFVPYVGSAAALGLGLLMSVLDWHGIWQIVGVVAVYAVVQFLEGFVITPRIMGGKVGLPAVWVLFALLAGGELFGFLGILLAVPVAAVVKIFVVHGIERYRESPFFLQGAPAGSPPSSSTPADPSEKG